MTQWVWLVFGIQELRDEIIDWSLVGVYTTEALAIAACKFAMRPFDIAERPQRWPPDSCGYARWMLDRPVPDRFDELIYPEGCKGEILK